MDYSSYRISFPELHIDLGDIPTTVFGTPVRWYGLIIAFGFIIGVIYLLHNAKRFSLTEDNILDALIVGTPTGIICARLYYVLSEFSYFKEHPSEIIKIWNGGLAIYGGIIGALVALFILCRIKHIKFGDLADIGILGIMIGQIIGRWGNFVNREVFGKEYYGFFRMVLTDPANPLKRLSVHPLFLYESIWNLIGFVLLHFYSKKRKFSGEILLLYIAWYGIGRGFLEGMRIPTFILTIPGTGIAVSQLLGFTSGILALIVWVYITVTKRKQTRSQGVDKS